MLARLPGSRAFPSNPSCSVNRCSDRSCLGSRSPGKKQEAPKQRYWLQRGNWGTAKQQQEGWSGHFKGEAEGREGQTRSREAPAQQKGVGQPSRGKNEGGCRRMGWEGAQGGGGEARLGGWKPAEFPPRPREDRNTVWIRRSRNVNRSSHVVGPRPEPLQDHVPTRPAQVQACSSGPRGGFPHIYTPFHTPPERLDTAPMPPFSPGDPRLAGKQALPVSSVRSVEGGRPSRCSEGRRVLPRPQGSLIKSPRMCGHLSKPLRNRPVQRSPPSICPLASSSGIGDLNEAHMLRYQIASRRHEAIRVSDAGRRERQPSPHAGLNGAKLDLNTPPLSPRIPLFAL